VKEYREGKVKRTVKEFEKNLKSFADIQWELGILNIYLNINSDLLPFA